MPLKIVKHIKTDYYVSPHEFQKGVQYLVNATGLNPGAKTVFCNWQYLGRSAPVVANEIKNRGQFKVTGQIDLTKPPHDWPSSEVFQASTFLLADDFAGSGRTIRSLFKPEASILQAILNRYPGSQVKILLLAAYEDAIRDLGEVKMKASDRIAVCVYRLLRTWDRCFTTDSRIFPVTEERDQLREFCITVAKKHFPKMPVKHCLGFEGMGSLFVFHNTVPNNTLPIIWYDNNGSGWTPLFPARGLEFEMQD